MLLGRLMQISTSRTTSDNCLHWVKWKDTFWESYQSITDWAWHLKLLGVDRSDQTRQVHTNSHTYTCIHHRIQLAVGDMTMSGWKPTISLIPPPSIACHHPPHSLLAYCTKSWNLHCITGRLRKGYVNHVAWCISKTRRMLYGRLGTFYISSHRSPTAGPSLDIHYMRKMRLNFYFYFFLFWL